MATIFSELAEQVSTVNQQARALVGQTNAILRQLAPLVEHERNSSQKPEPKLPRVLGEQLTKEDSSG